jgi:hypothetical protein
MQGLLVAVAQLGCVVTNRAFLLFSLLNDGPQCGTLSPDEAALPTAPSALPSKL